MWCNDIYICDATILSAQKKALIKSNPKRFLLHVFFFSYAEIVRDSFIYLVSLLRTTMAEKIQQGEGWVTVALTRAVKIQGPRRWCLPSSREPWRCPSEARFRHLLPSPQTRRDGLVFRSPGGPRGRWYRVVRCWSPGSGCNMWAQRLTPSRSPLPTLWEVGRGGEGVLDIITINLQLAEEVPRADEYVVICVDHYLFMALLTCNRS